MATRDDGGSTRSGVRSTQETTVIGRGTHVRGRIAGEGDVEIHGRVDGDVTLEGDVTVEQGGLVASNVSARRIVVRGAVKGDLVATESIVLEEGARVVGDVRAARISIAGGLVRGYVQSGDGQSAPRAASKSAARPVVAGAPKAAPAPVASAARPAQASSNGSPAKKAAPAPAAVVHVSRDRGNAPRAISLAGGGPAAKHGPPAPAMPSLKKGAKGALKKKA
jgi:cytoskeletal protein CcmA (bactofilin family)